MIARTETCGRTHIAKNTLLPPISSPRGVRQLVETSLSRSAEAGVAVAGVPIDAINAANVNGEPIITLAAGDDRRRWRIGVTYSSRLLSRLTITGRGPTIISLRGPTVGSVAVDGTHCICELSGSQMAS